MKCSTHPYEQGPGVCAPCLHDRLLALLDTHNRPHLTPVHHHNPDPSPPPLLSASSRHGRRFFSTPQSGPAAGGGGGRFSLLSYLFSHRRSEEKEPDSVPSEHSKLGSWFRTLIRGRRRRKRSRLFTAAEEVVPGPATATAPYGVSNRGMSPAAVEESECGSESGYSTASSGAWRMPTPSPMRRAAATHRRHHHHHYGGGGGITGISVCLSPLVWASPGRRRGQTPEVGFSGELCGSSNSLHLLHHHHHHPHHRHAPGGAALAPNRSRKLADFGRFQ